MINKKGLVVTLSAIAFSAIGIIGSAMAPVITDPGDYIVGDLEEKPTFDNAFGFPDAIDLDASVTDETPDAGLLWSYAQGPGVRYSLNGVAPIIGGDDPNAPGPKEVRGQDLDNPPFLKSGAVPQDGSGATATIRDILASPGFGNLAGYPDPGAGVFGSDTMTLFASDSSTYGQVSIVVYSQNETSDSLSGGMENIFDFDFEGDPTVRTGWMAEIQGGATAGTTGTSTGFCMWVPLTNVAGAAIYWFSPHNRLVANGATPGYITLVDSTVYRTRLTVQTDQTGNSRIPFWTHGYNNNFYISPPTLTSNIYGGDASILDVAGGTNGVGRTQGRTEFDFWFCPNAMLTKQWRGQDAWNASFSPFNPTVDNRNDMNLSIRILDGAQAVGSILNQNDTGYICLKRMRGDRVLYSKLVMSAKVPGPGGSAVPLNTATHNVQNGVGAFEPGTISNANANATFTLGPNIATNAATGRKKLLHYNPAGADPTLREWPFANSWSSDEILVLKTKIRSGVGAPAGTVEGTDPINLIQHTWDTVTFELTNAHFTQKGTAGNMKWAASPRLLSTTGNATGEEYVSFMYTQNRTKNPPVVTNGDRIRGFADFINSSGIGNSTDGLNPFIVETLELHKVTGGY